MAEEAVEPTSEVQPAGETASAPNLSSDAGATPEE